MRQLRLALFLSGFLAAIAAPARAADDAGDWVPLFDGQSLTGWKATGPDTGFKVDNGEIAFEGARSQLLYAGSVRNGDFKNFEFKAEVRLAPGAASGISFHTVRTDEASPTTGLKIELNNTHAWAMGHPDLERTGSLLRVRDLCRAVAKDDEWFTVRAAVRGKRVQVWVNDLPVVDYTEPANFSPDPRAPGRRLGHGAFALEGRDAASKVRFRKLVVKPLADNLPEYPEGPVRVDPVDQAISAYIAAGYPLIDFHTHLKGGLTMQGVLDHTLKTGINHGVAVNGGLGFSLTNDAGIDDFLKSVAGQPVFIGMQAEGREWPKLFSPAAVARFDYVFTDGMTIFDHRGKRARLWIKEEVDIPDPQEFMDHLTDTIVKILEEEPVDIYANPTFLPEVLAQDYERLWTAPRMERIIRAAAKSGVAIEINNRYRIPSARFILRARSLGLKFTLGTNNTAPNLARDEYGLEMIKACGLRPGDFWMPKPAGQKPIQRRLAK